MTPTTLKDLHHMLDWECGPDWSARLEAARAQGTDLNAILPESGEALLHVATRRRRVDVVRQFVQGGAELDVRTRGGKTALVHARRRGFEDVAAVLVAAGADFAPTPADELAIALSNLDLAEAERILASHPDCARTGNPEEDRLLADMTGRREREPVELLLGSGAPLDVPGLDGGTPLHCAAWFGQLHHVRRLLEVGAPLDVWDACHHSTPLHWAIHGAEFSDTGAELADDYAEIVRLLLAAGATTRYPEGVQARQTYRERLFENPPPAVRAALVEFLGEPHDSTGPGSPSPPEPPSS